MLDTAIILAGGLGTRLRPLTDSIPKPLLPMKGKPILQHVIENLKRFGVKNIILSIGYQAEQIKDFFKDGREWDINISYSIESEPLGTGGAIKQASRGLEKPFFLVWGDNLMDIDYNEMYKSYLREAPQVMMVLTPREDVENFGVAQLEENKITNFVEKPSREEAPSKLINAGVFIIEPKCLKILPEGKSSMEHDCFEKLALLGEISAYEHQGQWFPTDTLEKYRDACLNFNVNINLEKKKVIIADVDETICESCQEVSSRMAYQINKLIKKGYQFAFISGTKDKDLLKMISSGIKKKHHLLATTGTKYLVVEGENKINHYNHSFSEEEKKEILAAIDKLIERYDIQSMTTKEDQVQDRESQITLSAIGRHAPIELKADYDPNNEKRKVWVQFLKELLGEEKYEFNIGGKSSLDVTRKGLDKEWGIKEFLKFNQIDKEEVLFLGDKLYPGGNDYPASKVVDCLAVKNPDDTLKKLRMLP